MVERLAGRVAASAVSLGRRMATRERLEAHWRMGAAMGRAAQRIQRWWRQRRQVGRLARRARVRDAAATRLLAFWTVAATQVAAARRIQCWLRGRRLLARLAGRRRQLEAAGLGREILAQLAAAHEARLAMAGKGEESSAGEVPGATEELHLTSAERVEDARAWAAADLRRLAGVSEDVVEARLRRQRVAYEARLRGESRARGLSSSRRGWPQQ